MYRTLVSKPYGQMIRKFLLLFVTFFITLQLHAQDTLSIDQKMQWFKDAKLGIFIHWGIYSVKGIGESWSFHNGHISHEEYMKQIDGFTAEKYDPTHWVKLIKESGAKYTVITSKHHDGVALWDTHLHTLSIPQKSPAKSDVLRKFVDAVRNENMKLGLYYSLIDWSHDSYPNFLRNQKRYEYDSIRWKQFTQFNHGQIKEISTRFNPDLVWFDGDWEFSAEQWKAKEIRSLLQTRNPNVIINSRLQGYGDYATPEQGLPITKPQDKYWELCYTMNNSWGYQPLDTQYKTTNQIIRVLVDCISLGGNLLLDIGPKPDGTIPKEQVQILQELGRWTKKHHEAIYGTISGIPHGHFYGPTAMSKDKKTLYLYLDHSPNGLVTLKGLINSVKSAKVVGSNRELKTQVVGKLAWNDFPGILYIDLPKEELDQDVTVIALTFDESVRLYREDSKAIESN